MQSTGAVQTSGIQQVLQVNGLNELLTLPADAVLPGGGRLLIDLMDKDGQKPFLNGVNHLVWQDGEPIDPFILAVLAQRPGETGAPPEMLFQREIYNRGHDFLELAPLQRLLSARQPCGFDPRLASIPPWAQARLTPDARQFLGRPADFLAARAAALIGALTAALRAPHQGAGPGALTAAGGQGAVDEVVSFTERLALVSVPRSTTVGWLNILLHYGHTVSGSLADTGSGNPLLSALAASTGLTLTPTTGGRRDEPNSRWLVAYTKGIMDTDALSDFVFGELYVPVTVQPPADPVRLSYAWQFPAAMAGAVAGYACLFDRPFWARFQVDGDTRTAPLPDGGTVTEVLTPPATPTGYRYTASGFSGVTAYQGSFQLTGAGAGETAITLSWSVEFTADSGASVVQAASVIALAAAAMTAAMETHFGPRPVAPGRQP